MGVDVVPEPDEDQRRAVLEALEQSSRRAEPGRWWRQGIAEAVRDVLHDAAAGADGEPDSAAGPI
jgi:hypothetical protein